MAKTKLKARKTRKAGTAKAKAAKVQAAGPKDVFRQPLEILQNSFNSIMNCFK